MKLLILALLLTITSCSKRSLSLGKGSIDIRIQKKNEVELQTVTRSCAPQPMNSLGGTQDSIDGGQSFGSCQGFTCTPGVAFLVGSDCILNNAPVTTPATYIMDKNSSLTNIAAATDSDGNALTYSIVSNVSNGALTLDSLTGSFTYIPTNNFSGLDSFTFKVNDGTIDSNVSQISFEVICPDGFIKVPGNVTLGVSSFCVMQFEARQVASAPSSLSSDAATSPWGSITIGNAKQACLSRGSDRYDLISNPEWLAIASNIEMNAINWSSGIIGTGMIPRGNSDGSAGFIGISDLNDPYSGTGNSSAQGLDAGWEQKRTHTLSNGNTIWDFAGNSWEWTDWSMAAGLQLGPTTCTQNWVEFREVACAELAAADYHPSSPAYDSWKGFGIYNGGSSGGATIRGGNFTDGNNAGVYTLNLVNTIATVYSDIGFRCVYRF